MITFNEWLENFNSDDRFEFLIYGISETNPNILQKAGVKFNDYFKGWVIYAATSNEAEETLAKFGIKYTKLLKTN
jgi:hypothetical protein